MTIPTRWHEPSCKTPQVVVDGNFPECRSCGSNASALLRRAAEEPAPSYSGINLPPETPIGQMDLLWPPCVPYTRNGVPRAQLDVASEDTAILTPQTSASTLSDIYPSSLGKDHFRLLYLSGSRLIDSPIHGDLVEYLQHNCPEYETTSYTWGGEDGDATPCKPAYFGEFWDMLFLTRNCWSLLQYLRPEMGFRVVWVDAICINQYDIPERGAQVSSMPQIYRNCMRVVIYPGNHVVCKEQGRFRQKRTHNDVLEHGDTDTVDDSGLDIWGSVLQSRYISRVWIIQELILAPNAVLALKHHDLYLSNNLLHLVSQKDGRRGWLEFMAQAYKLRQTTLIEALRRTSDSQATDPRDKIFGILGILGVNPTYSKIVPNYSISMRDCVIGAVGLTVTISNEIWPLLHVHTSDSPWGYPSWVPNLDKVAVTTEEPPPRRRSLRQTFVRRGSISSPPGDWNTLVFLDFGPGKIVDAPHILKVRSEIPWCQDASIDSGSGALTLRLVLMFDKPHKIATMKRETSDKMIVDEYRFSVEGPSAAAWFASSKLPEKPEQPCYIFLAFHVQSASRKTVDGTQFLESDIYIVFATEADVSGTFSMVQCFPLDDAVCACMSSPPPPPPSLRFWELEQSTDLGKTRAFAGSRSDKIVMSLSGTLHLIFNYNTRKQTLPHREYDWHRRGRTDITHRWHRLRFEVSEAMLFDMIVPGKGNSASGFVQLSLSAGRAGSPITITKEFTEAYAKCLQMASAELNPVLDDEYVWFTLTDDESLSHYWKNLTKHISDAATKPRWWRKQKDLWLPWDILFPTWFDLQIPGIGNTLFNDFNCDPQDSEAPSDSEVREKGKDAYKDYTPSSNRCALHEDYISQGDLSLKYWLPCSAEPTITRLQMPVKARMPLTKVIEAIRGTELNRLHRHLLAFGEKLGEDPETLLERGPQPEDHDVYLQEWRPEPLVKELGFVWREELVTFV